MGSMSVENLLIFLLIGAIAGWLAGQVVRGYGFGLLGNIVVGVIGAFLGGYLFPRFGLNITPLIVGSIISAFLGALILLLLIRIIKRA